MTARLLIVDDEDRLREMMAYTLQDEGYHVDQAADGEQAIQQLQQAAAADAPYDLLITDIVMGDMDGIELMKASRSLSVMPEVILLTGHGSLESAIEAVASHAFAYLLKPCPPAELREHVAAALQRRSLGKNQQEKAAAWNAIADAVAQIQGRQDSDAPAAASEHGAQTGQEMPEEPLTSSPEQPARYLRVGRLCIDTYHHKVLFDNQQVHTTPIEYEILICLAAVPERPVSFSDIVQHTHGQNIDRREAQDLLSWHVRNLRKKIDRRYLASVRGVGYMLSDPEKAAPGHLDEP